MQKQGLNSAYTYREVMQLALAAHQVDVGPVDGLIKASL